MSVQSEGQTMSLKKVVIQIKQIAEWLQSA